MIKLVSDTVDRSDIDALREWLNQDPIPQLTKGPLTRKLESKWSEYLGVKHTVYVNSGSSAILLMLAALKSFQKLKNNRVIVPALSWLTDVSSCMQLGFEPILCDCNLEDLSADLGKLELSFKANKPSIFILVHVVGLVPDMEKIVELCKKYKVILLEDACEAMGSEFNGRKLGTFGLMSVFSLYFGHHISTIEGGFLSTDNDKLAELSLMLRSHGWDRDLNTTQQDHLREEYNIDSFNAQYTFYEPGFNLRATDLQAFIGLRQIPKLDEITVSRECNFYSYYNTITNNKLKLRATPSNLISNFAYPVVHSKRKEIVEQLKVEGVEVRPLIAGSMAKQPFWLKKYYPVFLPNCELIHNEGFYLPNHSGLLSADIEKISKIIMSYGPSDY